ncbi:MAG: hypothetical protein KDB27_24110, partial [Planctomycetales bacterium]|nr:hypothetical protein [Planctomycetales bacterium]
MFSSSFGSRGTVTRQCENRSPSRFIHAAMARSALVAAIVSFPCNASIMIPDGLEPGDTYQLVFNSSRSISATSSDIETYNRFVQSVADRAGLGDSEGITWSAIVSTADVDARDNAIVGFDTPVYNFNMEKVATGYDDMWDGRLL